MTERRYELGDAAVRYRGRNRKTTFGENGKEKSVSTGIASIGLCQPQSNPHPKGVWTNLGDNP